MSFRSFLGTKDFRNTLVRILLIYAFAVVIAWLFLWWYTDHGKQVTVPDLRGKNIAEAAEELNTLGVQYLVIDSLFDEKESGGKIIEQSPAPGSSVKEGREIFLTIYRYQPPMEKINIEEGESAQVAIIKLKNKGVNYEIKYVPNNSMVGSVISLTHRGKKLRKDELVPRGDKVFLQIGISDNGKVDIPNLIGLNYKQVIQLLDSLNLTPQAHFVTDVSAADSTLLRVCRQMPEPDGGVMGISPGEFIDFWLNDGPCSPDSTNNND
jgi:beta-lactam-binding protein with PASTA domain